MKKFILVFIMFIMASVTYAGNEVYINQSGSGLDLDITLDGDGSFVGSSTAPVYIKGELLDINIDVDGTSEILGSIYITGDSNRGTGNAGDTGGAEVSLTSQGAGVDYTLNIGGTSDLSVGSSVVESRTNSGTSDGGTSKYIIGYSTNQAITWTSTDSTTAETYTAVTGSGDYTDIDVTLKGSNIDINVLEASTDTSTSDTKRTQVVMDTNSVDVDIDIDHTGAGNHDTILDINGSAASTDFRVNQSGGTDSTVNMIFDGASSSDIDVIISP
jgi:hypothetical protein